MAIDVIWQNPVGLSVTSTTLTKTASTQWGNAGVNSMNRLKAGEDGILEYVLANTTTSFAFGFGMADTSVTNHYVDIEYGFLKNGSSLYIVASGITVATVTRFHPGDHLTIIKESGSCSFYKNDALLFGIEDDLILTSDMRLEVAMYNMNTELSDFQISFYAPLKVTAFKQDGASFDQNTGFIELFSQYGLPPYEYMWMNNSSNRVLYDLSPGDYSVSVTDSLKIDTVKLSFTIGQKTNWTDVVNMTFQENKLLKINQTLPASATTSNYFEGGTNGWYEVKLIDLNNEFNFVLQEFSLPSKTTYHQYGIELKSGVLNPVFEGVAVTSTVLAASAGDVIRIERKGNKFYIRINGVEAYSRNIESIYNMAGRINLINALTEIIGPSAQAPKPLEGLLLTCYDDNSKNWSKTILYDGSGNSVSESKDYFDNMGRPTQSLVKNISQNTVIATQTLYDAYGRAVLQTLPAPTFESELCYRPNFIANQSGTQYTYNDFDKPDNSNIESSGEVNHPGFVSQNDMGSLGWYYGNNNNIEPYVPYATTPYQRMEYNSLSTTDVKKVSKPGNSLNHGSGHESYSFAMPTIGELNYMFGYGGSWTTSDLTLAFTNNDYTGQINTAFFPNAGEIATKEISRDENGVESVTFTDVKGNVIASCLSGQQNGVNVKTQSVQGILKPLDETRRYIDVHLPDGCQSSLTLYQNTGSQYVYNIYDLKTGKTVLFSGNENYSGTQPNLSPGFYRIYLKGFPHTALSTIPVRQQLNYYNFTLNYYDRANRLKVSIPPNGFDSSYVFSPQISNVGNKLHFNALSNTKVYSGNLATVDWSMNSSVFSNEVPVTLPPAAPFQLSNVIVSINYKKDWSTVSTSTGGYNPSQRTANDFYASANFSEPTVILDTTDFNPPVVSYDSLGVAHYSVPGNGGGSNPNPCGIVLAVPFRFWFQLQDQNNTPLTNIYNDPVTIMQVATCYLHSCPDGSTFRTWDMPPPVQYYLNPTQSAAITGLKMKIVNVLAYTGQPFNTSILYDLEASVGVNTHQMPGSPQHKLPEISQYNSWSEVLTTITPDAGQTDYVYSNDGKAKYTQNSKQDASNATVSSRNFSYVNYDEYQRPFESGEFVPTTIAGGGAPANSYFESYSENKISSTPLNSASVINKTEISLLDNFRTRERNFISYDLADPDFYTLTGLSSTAYKQEYVAGDVSFSYNDNKRTWYSYDELGRMVWIVQRYENTNGPGTFAVKTFNYKYDFLDNVLEVDYQKETATESFYQYYIYDADKRLKQVLSSRDGVSRKEEAAYYYYLHGPVKRVELAGKLQGVDYVYTINGWLKNINAPEMDNLRDPGKDGQKNSKYNVPKDLFGLSLDYYDGDYEKQATYVQTYPEPVGTTPSTAPDLFNGIIKAQRWQIKPPAAATGLNYKNQHLFYGYAYDKKYQLQNASFGVWDADGIQNYPSGEGIFVPANITMSNNYKVSGMTYDYNGNIKTLTRNAYAGGTGGIDMDNLSYTYLPHSNKLEKVTDAVSTNPYNELGYKPGQSANNFQYNSLGELMSDANDDKAYIYNSHGQITRVSTIAGTPIVEYDYDEADMRIVKRSFSSSNVLTTLYVRDGNGIVMSIYEKTTAAPTYELKEWNVEGAGRIATAYNTGAPSPLYVYELNDHLGNVRTTFKPALVTNATFDFNGNGTYDYLISDPASTIDNTVNMSGSSGGSIKTISNTQPAGASIGKIPVKNGQTVNVTAYSYYLSGLGFLPPSGALELRLVDENGNTLAGNNLVQTYVPSGVGTWNQLTASFTITENYPNMFVTITPKIYAINNKVIWFDNIDVQLSGTGAGIVVPEQLSVASYYPHGSVMPGLSYNSSIGGRYGYQGQFAENDKEINETFFELRNYNPLTARFNTTDPYGQYHSPYMAMGNNQINSVDPDGGNALSIVMGAAGGAVIGGVTGWAIAKGKGLDKNEQWKYAGIGAGIGAVAGGITGAFFDVNSIRTGHKNGHVTHRLEITGNNSWLSGKRHGSDGHVYRKSKPVNTSRHGFSMGYRFGNMIWFDIRLGVPVYKKPWDKNFPNFGKRTHLFLFKTIPSSSPAYYPPMGPSTHSTEDVPHMYKGGRWRFYECGDDLLPTHKRETKHR